MSELSPDVKAFLERSKGVYRASSVDRERVRTALGARLALPLPAPAPHPPAGPSTHPPAAGGAPPTAAANPGEGATAGIAKAGGAAKAGGVAGAAKAGGIAAIGAAKTTTLVAAIAPKLIAGALLVASGGAAVGVYDRALAPRTAPANVATATRAPPPVPLDAAARKPADAAGATDVNAEPPAAAPLDTTPAGGVVAPTAATSASAAPFSSRPTSLTGATPLAARSPAMTSSTRAGVPAGEGAPGDAGQDVATAIGVASAPAPVAPPASAPDLPGEPAPPATTLGREVALVREAQAALRRGDARTALAKLDEHTREFPSGELREERRAARVLALCALGRVGDARAEAAALLEGSPNSPYSARVRTSCVGQAGR